MGQPALFISQKDNFKGNFGFVLRSSAFFYYRKDSQVCTTISLLNYWSLKRGINVRVLASIRDMGGKLILREPLNFDSNMVVNYSPYAAGDKFEGSIEIEAFSTENMIIPYSAVMAFYETSRGISMVHSYSRVYSPHEIEEGRTISIGEESCWTILDDERTYSFGVFHNGIQKCPEQQVTLRVRNFENAVRSVEFKLTAMNPYQTIIIKPSDHIPDLSAFLAGKPGNAAVSFRVEGGFTRMLIGNARKDQSDLQLTHSNFNYSTHQSDHVVGAPQVAFMDIPYIFGARRELVVYPDCDKGRYQMSESEGDSQQFSDGSLVSREISGKSTKIITFKKDSGELPSRIVTGIRLQKDTSSLPAECSLGVDHFQCPPKRFWWSTCCIQPDKICLLYVHAMEEIFGPWKNQTIVLRLYSDKKAGYQESVIQDYHSAEQGLSFADIFPQGQDFLCGQIGWFTFFSEYTGFKVYALLENKYGSLTFEHGF